MLLAIDGVVQDIAVYFVNARSGGITMTSPPVVGADITAGFTFDVPVRFASDRLDLSLEAFGAGELTNVPLIEVSDA